MGYETLTINTWTSFFPYLNGVYVTFCLDFLKYTNDLSLCIWHVTYAICLEYKTKSLELWNLDVIYHAVSLYLKDFYLFLLCNISILVNFLVRRILAI